MLDLCFVHRNLLVPKVTSFYALMVPQKLVTEWRLLMWVYHKVDFIDCLLVWNLNVLIFLHLKDFQEGDVAPIFLLTSQVGGLGLTLTKADRVIVVDPAWNPRCLLFSPSWTWWFIIYTWFFWISTWMLEIYMKGCDAHYWVNVYGHKNSM